MKGLLTHKRFGGVVKDVDTVGRKVSGYLTAFGNVDHDGDIGEKGMFEKSIAERGPGGRNEIFFLNQHRWHEPHGKFAELYEDDYGLAFVSNPMPNTSYSKDALELYSKGILNEHSYGYRIVRSKWDETAKANRLLEVKLYEGSNVTLGANPLTPFTGFKNLSVEDQMSEIEQKTNAIIKMLRHGTVTDDTMLQLEIALEELKSYSNELAKKATSEPTVETVTLKPEDIKAAFAQIRSKL